MAAIRSRAVSELLLFFLLLVGFWSGFGNCGHHQVDGVDCPSRFPKLLIYYFFSLVNVMS
jgi:hypothetical protein